MSWIEEIIRERGGAVSFHDFMELALYHPEHGYYRAGPVRFGRDGDFMTAPTASPWYARTVAHLLRRLAVAGERWTVVDLAAGDGSFLADLAGALASGAGSPLASLVGVERSSSLRHAIGDRLAPLACPLRAVGDVAELGPFDGPVLAHASELYDALPVYRVMRRGGTLLELWVAAGAAGLEWLEKPAGAHLAAYLTGHGISLDDGQVAEIGLATAALHRRVLEACGPTAVALILEYGYPARRLYDPRGRRHGSLVAYRRHRPGRDVLAAPGESDLTAHVNLDDLELAARSAGWRELGVMPLAEGLVRAGLAEVLEAAGLGPEAPLGAATLTARQEVKRLLDPDGMGSDLKLVVQATPTMAERVQQVLARGPASHRS